MQNLTRKGLVRSQRGVRGGFLLAKPPEDITILDVVNAVDPIQRIRSCPLELKSHGVRLCPLHFRMDRALAMVEDAFRKSTLAEILAEDKDQRTLWMADGNPPAEGKRHRIAFNTYDAQSGGLRLPRLFEILNRPASKRVETAVATREALIGYLAEKKVIG